MTTPPGRNPHLQPSIVCDGWGFRDSERPSSRPRFVRLTGGRGQSEAPTLEKNMVGVPKCHQEGMHRQDHYVTFRRCLLVSAGAQHQSTGPVWSILAGVPCSIKVARCLCPRGSWGRSGGSLSNSSGGTPGVLEDLMASLCPHRRSQCS
jgi:hypothetical protein